MIHNRDPQVEPDSTPTLNPSARLLWRAAGQIQVELGARRVVVDGVDQATVRRLTMPSPDGRHDLPDVPDSAVEALHAAVS